MLPICAVYAAVGYMLYVLYGWGGAERGLSWMTVAIGRYRSHDRPLINQVSLCLLYRD